MSNTSNSKLDVWSLLSKYNTDPTVLKLKSKFSQVSLFDIIRKSRKEDVHTWVIAWLIKQNPAGLVMKGLANIIAKRYLAQKDREGGPEMTEEQLMPFLVAPGEISVESVDDEYAVPDIGRFDIMLECVWKGKHYTIILENKVESEEHFIEKKEEEGGNKIQVWQTKRIQESLRRKGEI